MAMSMRSVAVVVGISALVHCAVAGAQSAAPVVPLIDLVGTSEITEAKAAITFNTGVAQWRAGDPLRGVN